MLTADDLEAFAPYNIDHLGVSARSVNNPFPLLINHPPRANADQWLKEIILEALASFDLDYGVDDDAPEIDVLDRATFFLNRPPTWANKATIMRIAELVEQIWRGKIDGVHAVPLYQELAQRLGCGLKMESRYEHR